MQLLSVVSLLAVAATVSAQSTCSQTKVQHLKNHITHPKYFCQFWLRGGVDRQYSALSGMTAGQLTSTCECLLEDAGKEVRPIKKYPVASAGYCDESLATEIEAEFTQTRFFCEYYQVQNRRYTPVRSLTPQQIYDGCACYVGNSAPSPNATTSATTSSATSTGSVTLLPTSSETATSSSSSETTATSTSESTSITSSSSSTEATTAATTGSDSTTASESSTAVDTTSVPSTLVTMTSDSSTVPTSTYASATASATNNGTAVVFSRRRLEKAMADYLEEVNGEEM